MKRRTFIQHTASAALLGAAGCSQQITLKRGQQRHSQEITREKPAGGAMPTTELGETGIRASKFGFGAHMTVDLAMQEAYRGKTIREAYELGVTLFDVYDHSYNWPVNQYGPMGKHLKPMINDVLISVNMAPKGILTMEQEMQRMLMLFGRDHIDLIRSHAYSPDQETWEQWDALFRFREKGMVRAVGCPIHLESDLSVVLEQELPIDFVILPYNFYHNILWDGRFPGDFHPLARILRARDIGIITMKPFGTDYFVNPLIDAAKQLDPTGGEISLPQAALRYILNSGLEPDIILGGMYNINHVYENIPAFYAPSLSPEESALLERIRQVATVQADNLLPDHYRFLNRWAPDSPVHKSLPTT